MLRAIDTVDLSSAEINANTSRPLLVLPRALKAATCVSSGM
jgi:hypothetical protein